MFRSIVSSTVGPRPIVKTRIPIVAEVRASASGSSPPALSCPSVRRMIAQKWNEIPRAPSSLFAARIASPICVPPCGTDSLSMSAFTRA